MDITSEIRARLAGEWLPEIYLKTVRPQRTRSYRLDVPPKENAAEILHTLLGIELKVGKRRLACPDLSTARYLRVFARIGCAEVAVPYDITRISAVADELETAWHKTMLLIAENTKSDTPRAAGRNRGRIVKAIRAEIESIGAGDAMPEFKQAASRRNA
ncbi:MAG TPA: hypothetical protein VK468_02130 [Pyrinomonadaceae bacterium]|nr:hypothetical protein [Pyrinomonadaceae bacterium]